jgi:hypothetical protein
MDYNVQERVKDNLKLAEGLKELKGIDRLAARKLFSVLTDLETIAVAAAERGDAIEGQLEDEYVHYYSFLTCAEVLGGKDPTAPSIQSLLDFLKSLKGEMSLILLNITAESWLEVFLHDLAKTNICSGLFAEIEKDEARHASEARKLGKPKPSSARPMMMKLENLLLDLTREPEFILPVMHFAGSNAMSKMGIRVLKAHKKACKFLGVKPSDRLEETIEIFQRAVALPEPRKMVMDEWQQMRMDLWEGQAGPMIGRMLCPYQGSVVSFEVPLAQAICYALDMEPVLNRVTANGQLYQCKVPVVGLRRYDEIGRVYSIYLSNSHIKSKEEVRNELREATKLARTQPYCSLPNWREYKGLSPVPRAAAIITHVGFNQGMAYGTAPLVPAEGNAISVTTNMPTEIPHKRKWVPWPRWERVVPVNGSLDHRAMDGRDAAKFMARCVEWFENYEG